MRNENTAYPPPQWGKLFCTVSRICNKKKCAAFALLSSKGAHQHQSEKSLKSRAKTAVRQGLLLSAVLIFRFVNQFLSVAEQFAANSGRPRPHLRNKF